MLHESAFQPVIFEVHVHVYTTKAICLLVICLNSPPRSIPPLATFFRWQKKKKKKKKKNCFLKKKKKKKKKKRGLISLLQNIQQPSNEAAQTEKSIQDWVYGWGCIIIDSLHTSVCAKLLINL